MPPEHPVKPTISWKQRWVQVGALFLAIAILVVMGLAWLNLRAMEKHRIQEIRALGQTIGRTTVDFLLLKQYDQLLDWMNLLTQTTQITGLALYADQERVLQTGPAESFVKALPVLPPADPKSGHLEKTGNRLRFYLPLTGPNSALPRQELLVIEFSLEAFQLRQAYIRLALGGVLILSLSIMVLVVGLEKAQRRLRRQNQILDRTQGQLRQEELTKSEMLRAISHHAMQFLTAIYGRLFNLLEQKQAEVPSAELRQGLKIIRENTDGLKRSLENLRDNERLAKGQVQSNPRFIELVPLAQGALQSFEISASHRGVILDHSPPVSAVTAWADPEIVKTALMNLLDNAIKFTPAGGTVRLSLGQQAGWSEIYVQDQGPGLADGDRERIFTPFTRLHADVPGTGLGLSNSRRLVALQGGYLIVSASAPGTGSTFCLRLPAEPPDKLPFPREDAHAAHSDH